MLTRWIMSLTLSVALGWWLSTKEGDRVIFKPLVVRLCAVFLHSGGCNIDGRYFP